MRPAATNSSCFSIKSLAEETTKSPGLRFWVPTL